MLSRFPPMVWPEQIDIGAAAAHWVAPGLKPPGRG